MPKSSRHGVTTDTSNLDISESHASMQSQLQDEIDFPTTINTPTSSEAIMIYFKAEMKPSASLQRFHAVIRIIRLEYQRSDFICKNRPDFVNFRIIFRC